MRENALTGQVRSLRDIEADIWARKRNVTLDVLAMGRDLMEAKEQLEHGEWLAWLEKMDFGLRTAENWMRLAREVSPESSLAALPYTKALALLSAPTEEREQLAEQAGDKSAAELKKLAQEAKAAKEETARIAEELKQKQAELRQSESRKMDLWEELQRVRKAPKIVEVAPEDYAELKDAVETLKQENDELTQAVEEAEQRAQAAWGAPRPEQKAVDHLALLSAATEFLSKAERIPQMDAELRALEGHELRSMEITVGSIRAWVERMDSALTKARLGLHVIDGEGAVL